MKKIKKTILNECYTSLIILIYYIIYVLGTYIIELIFYLYL